MARQESEQTDATRGETDPTGRRSSTVPLGWWDLGVISHKEDRLSRNDILRMKEMCPKRCHLSFRHLGFPPPSLGPDREGGPPRVDRKGNPLLIVLLAFFHHTVREPSRDARPFVL